MQKTNQIQTSKYQKEHQNNLDEDGEPLDGVIKYQCEWIQGPPLDFEKYLKEINYYRQKLYDINLIGKYPQSIGFGNISYKNKKQNNFVITGSATGEYKNLNENHYCTVNSFDLEKNSLICTGPIKASSESMTHGTLYNINENINAVVHVHNYEMWKYLLYKVPTTSKKAKYGTPEIAWEVQRLFKETDVLDQGIFALEGHKDGIFTFGKNLKEAYNIILKYYQDIIGKKQIEQLDEKQIFKKKLSQNNKNVKNKNNNRKLNSRSRSRSRSVNKEKQ